VGLDGAAVINERLPCPPGPRHRSFAWSRALGEFLPFLRLCFSVHWVLSLPALLEKAGRSAGGKAAFNEQRGCNAVLSFAFLV